jgi:hypothetical protein
MKLSHAQLEMVNRDSGLTALMGVGSSAMLDSRFATHENKSEKC